MVAGIAVGSMLRCLHGLADSATSVALTADGEYVAGECLRDLGAVDETGAMETR